MKFGTRFLLTVALLSIAATASAMPMFARRYNMECAGCHSPIPRLNEQGFKFRAAGYRMPTDIGKSETPLKWGDAASGRMQMSLLSGHSKGSASTKAATDLASYANSNQIVFQEWTLYPLTMAFAKNYSSLVELSNFPDGIIEIENAYLRYNKGDEKQFFSARAGIFHPFEGYGAADRPISISRPLFETLLPTKTAGYYTIWGIDQMGIELGGDFDKTSVRATIFNGTTFKADEGKSVGAAGVAGNSELVKPKTSLSYNDKDYQVYVNQILTEDGGGLAALFYYGSTDEPRPGSPAAASGISGRARPQDVALTADDTSATAFKNKFTRLALFGSYPLGHAAKVQAGFQMGTDKIWDQNTRAIADTSLKSMGFFGSADYMVSENCWLGARYDQFKPNTGGSNNTVMAMTAYANVPLNNGIQMLAQYQYRATQKGRFTDVDEVRKDVSHNFEVRGIVIW